MAEQFPEEGGKIPWLGLEDGKQTGLPGHSPAPWGEMQRSRPLPPSPDRTGVSLGIFAFPLPKPRSTFPWHPHSQQSLLSFPSGTPVSLVTAPAVPHPPSPKPPSPAAAPDSHLPLGTLSIHSRHRRCHSATRCPQPWPKAAWDPCPGVPQSWHPRALVLGTRGVPLRALPGSRGGSGSSLRHTRCPWAAGGGGGGPCGDTAKPAPGIKPGSARTAGAGVRATVTPARAPGAAMTPGVVCAAPADSSPGLEL